MHNHGDDRQKSLFWYGESTHSWQILCQTSHSFWNRPINRMLNHDSSYGLMVTSVTKGRTEKLPKTVQIVETYCHDHSLESTWEALSDGTISFSILPSSGNAFSDFYFLKQPQFKRQGCLNVLLLQGSERSLKKRTDYNERYWNIVWCSQIKLPPPSAKTIFLQLLIKSTSAHFIDW
jgi:hypothetical protein